MTAQQLDSQIEQWFNEQHNCQLDFEIDDALDKLVKLELVNLQNDLYSAVDLAKAKQRLDSRWDDYFKFA
ncbi:MAG: hypothetical protein AAGK05_13220 [Pseudomonadota bacterium]